MKKRGEDEGMNKKQLLITWGMVILISLIFFFPPRVKSSKILRNEGRYRVDWNGVLQYCIPCMLVGGLLIYTLKNKK